MKKLIGVWLFYFVIIAFFYRNSLYSYFEGDEWYYFSIFLPLTHHPFGLLETFIKSFTESNSISGGGHVAPLYNVIWFLLNKFFGLNFKYYIIFSLLTHTFNTFFLYIFTKGIIKNRIVPLLAGFIFAISCVHYEAITWVMAVVPTQISLLFTLLGLIFFIRKSFVISLVLFLAGIFTKETVILVMVLAPLLLLPSGKREFLKGTALSVIGMVIYLPIRFGIPLLVDKTPVHSLHIPIQSLFFYQILLVERMITEVFVSSNILLVLSRFVSEHTYQKMPSHLIPKESLELFSQSIGADILLLALSPIFIGVCVVVLQRTFRKKKNYEVLLFAVTLIVTSAFPLLFVLNYAPWWIEGAFIDSRHLYLPSIGASLLLSIGVYHMYKYLSKHRAKGVTITFFSILCVFWIWVQYAVIQKQADKFENLSVMRQSLLRSIHSYLPQLPQKAVILVESDTPYFGFGAIPPFQTNLGQVLALTYYEKNQLSPYFFTKAKYMEKGILGEGVVSLDNKTFGYYLNKSSMLRDLTLNKFSIEDVYAYYWVGGNNELQDKTREIRELATTYTYEVVRTKNWSQIVVEGDVKFSYPPDSQLTDVTDNSDALKRYELQIDDSSLITISLETKSDKLPFHEFLKSEKKSDQIPKDAEYYIKNIFRADGSAVTAVYIKSGDYARYFVPFGNGIGYLEFSAPANPKEIDRDIKYMNKEIELVISTAHF